MLVLYFCNVCRCSFNKRTFHWRYGHPSRIDYILEGYKCCNLYVSGAVHTQLSPLRLFSDKVYFLADMKGTSSANQMQDSQTPDNPLKLESMQIDEA